MQNQNSIFLKFTSLTDWNPIVRNWIILNFAIFYVKHAVAWVWKYKLKFVRLSALKHTRPSE